ncbi:Peroxiredoxin [Friedmanniella luteola]|uniref:thioredoxin-dependent peroxiredoxin n=1 Tax=Friedmanniella luteola TaxID=546871 RepID=A0A1H1W118_9ACTN|nr:peroxiredoxin [Friedmanniella luteola]SDS90733.1 Peroxiredoxin [Friedmanniella luteola]
MSAAVPEVGQTAPEFTARNQHGQTVTRADLLGAPAVLVFYPFAFSGICTSELGAFRDGLAEFSAVAARVLAISCDPVFALRAFADAEGLAFDLLSDHWPHGQVARDYGVFDEEWGTARRGSFVLDAAGTITWSVLTGLGEPRSIAEHLQALSAA